MRRRERPPAGGEGFRKGPSAARGSLRRKRNVERAGPVVTVDEGEGVDDAQQLGCFEALSPIVAVVDHLVGLRVIAHDKDEMLRGVERMGLRDNRPLVPTGWRRCLGYPFSHRSVALSQSQTSSYANK